MVFLLLGVVVTAGVALAALYLLQPMQGVIHSMFYLQVGPSEATETAIRIHFLVAGLGAFDVSMLAGNHLIDRSAHRAAFANAILGMLVLVVFLGVAVAGSAALLTALLVLPVASVSVPLLLRYRFEVRSGGIPAYHRRVAGFH